MLARIIVVAAAHLAAVEVVVHHILADDHPSLCVTTCVGTDTGLSDIIPMGIAISAHY